MPPISHGSVLLLADIEPAIRTFHAEFFPTPERCYPTLSNFGYLFPDLQRDPAKNLLLEEPQTAKNLIQLGTTMVESSATDPVDSEIPSAYTYFAQFVDHDITLEAVTKDVPLNSHLTPMHLCAIEQSIKNTRTATLDLDTVYEPAFRNGVFYPVPRDSTNPNKLKIDRAIVSPTSVHHPPGTDLNDSDLPREFYSQYPDVDRVAKIGDPRNDQNRIISQLHLAFLRAHNALIDQGKSFDEAATLLRQHYQWIVIHDFLPRIVESSLVTNILSGAIQIYDPPDDSFFLPLEFSVAAYRFGHSMIRSAYNYNAIFENGLKPTLFDLFRPQALGRRYHHILESWIIQWDRFVDWEMNKATNSARLIDTQLVDPLSGLSDDRGRPLKVERRLAIRDLLRGYLLRIPTGQAVARALSLPMMSATELEAVAACANPDQKTVLRNSGMSNRTPLWFYILAEAAHYNGGQRLGPVGGAIVASVLIGLVRRSKDSIFRYSSWSPTLGQVTGRFDLPDLFYLAKVLPCS
jgi:hypothetical protein